MGVVHTSGTVAALIRTVERIRRRRAGFDPTSVWANHVVVYIGNNLVVEATPGLLSPLKYHGVIVSPLREVNPPIRWSTGKDLGAPGSRIVEESLAMVGIPYGLLDIAAFLLALLNVDPPWLRARLNRPDRLFCSQAAARAVRLARQSEAIDSGVPLASVLGSDLGIVPGTPDSEQTPDDIARWLDTIKEGTSWSSTT